MIRLICAVVLGTAGAGLIGWAAVRIPDGSSDARLPALPVPVLPGMMRPEVEPALAAAHLRVESQTATRLEAVSDDGRRRLVVVFAGCGRVASVANREVASERSAAHFERLVAGPINRAGWQHAPSGSADQRYVHGRHEVLVRRLFECDSATPEECFYSVLEVHDHRAEQLEFLRP